MEQQSPVKLTKKQEIIKFIQFLFFSLSAGIIEVVTFTLLKEVVGLNYWVSYLPALIASVLWNFTVNRKFTFKSVSNVPVAMLKVAFYYVLFTPLSTWWGNYLSATDWGIGESLQGYIILVGTMIVNFVTEFMVYRFWVYRKTINTSESGQKEQEKYQ